MRGFFILMAMLALATGAHAMPACDPAELASLFKAGRPEKAAQRLDKAETPVPRYAFGTHKGYDFFYRYIIGTDGRIVCATLGSSYDRTPPEMTPQRQAWLDAMATWQFKPAESNGVPARALGQGMTMEEEIPPYHVMPPSGDPRQAVITLSWTPHLVSPSAFAMTIRGDGTVIYDPEASSDDDPIGKQTYRIDPQVVTQMLDAADKADFWSLRDSYFPAGFVVDGPSTATMTITLGNRTKTLSEDGGDGVPQAASRLFWTIADQARLELWTRTRRDTLAQLASNGFDFKSPRAGRLLLSLIADPETPQDVIDDLEARGTPTDTNMRGYPFDLTPLDAAIDGRRTTLAEHLIDQGALLTHGKPDHTKATRALAHAAETSSPALATRVMDYGPALVIRRNDATQTVDPILTFVGQAGGAKPEDDIATAQLLLDHGADINAQDDFKNSLLDNAVLHDNPALVAWLLEKGARMNNGYGLPPLHDARSEEMMMLLLDHGADLSDKDMIDEVVEDAKFESWPRVEAWLKAHGKWPAD